MGTAQKYLIVPVREVDSVGLRPGSLGVEEDGHFYWGAIKIFIKINFMLESTRTCLPFRERRDIYISFSYALELDFLEQRLAAHCCKVLVELVEVHRDVPEFRVWVQTDLNEPCQLQQLREWLLLSGTRK